MRIGRIWRALLDNPTRHPYRSDLIQHSFETIAENLIYYYQEDQQPRNSTAGYPIGKIMQELLQPLFTRFLPSDKEFYEAFDVFEFLLALHHLYACLSTDRSKPLLPRYGSHRGERSSDAILFLLEKGGRRGDDWDLLKSGLFGGSSQYVMEVLTAYQEKLREANQRFDFPQDFPDYLKMYRL